MAELCAVHCPHCGSYPGHPQTATSWRWVADHWEHRCAELHPQVGASRVERAAMALRRWWRGADVDD